MTSLSAGQVLINTGGSGGSGNAVTYDSTFTNASLSSGVLFVSHGLNSYPSAISVFNSMGIRVDPDEIDVISDNVVSVDLNSFTPLTDTWRISIIAGGASATSYETTFTDASLSISGWLPVTHGLNTYPSGVLIVDADGVEITPDEIDISSTNAISVNLVSFQPLAGTWRISVAA